jgi:hypothetical protein
MALRTATSRTAPERWEAGFFLSLFSLLVFQVVLFDIDIRALNVLRGAIAIFASVDAAVLTRLSYVIVPAIVLPLVYLLACRVRPFWSRRFLDAIGAYLIVRMVMQLIGLNVLVFDLVTPRFVLITQLLLFLPYSLLIWGWIYWRLDRMAGSDGRRFFRLDLEGKAARPIDYLVASFSSVFSASISSIKGNSARARILILLHGFMIYDIMGLTLSRAISLVQSR